MEELLEYGEDGHNDDELLEESESYLQILVVLAGIGAGAVLLHKESIGIHTLPCEAYLVTAGSVV